MVRPSARLIKPFYFVAFGLIAVVYGFNNNRTERLDWLIIPPGIMLLWAFLVHMRLRFTTLTVGGNRLRLETGFLSKTTRTMERTKIQDVRVDQSLWQRLLGLGNISIESAGETSRLTMPNVEKPHAIADFILDQAHR